MSGVSRDNQTVIERWDFPVQAGRWRIRPSLPPQPIGVAMGSFTASSTTGGLPYRPPEGGAHVQPLRTAIYRGGAIGHILSIECDPEGRYLLLLTTAAGLYRMDLTGAAPGDPVLVHSAATLPHLTTAIRLRLLKHPDDDEPGHWLTIDDAETGTSKRFTQCGIRTTTALSNGRAPGPRRSTSTAPIPPSSGRTSTPDRMGSRTAGVRVRRICV